MLNGAVVFAVGVLVIQPEETPRRPAQLPRVDEAEACTSFLEFRRNLQGIVVRRDARALLRVVDPDVYLSFGDERGHQAFRRMWLSRQSERDVWAQLGAVLSLGGRCEQGRVFVAPYVFTDWPNGLKSSEFRAVIATGVPLRVAPRDDAPVVSRLDFAIVRLTDFDTFGRRWLAVEASDGKAGFVKTAVLRSATDMRAWFMRKDGVWRMTTWIGGD